MHRLRSDFRLLILSAIIAGAFGTEARSTGIFEDAVGRAGFLYAPFNASAQSRITVTDSDSTTASTVVIAADFVVTHWFLLEVEQPYITAAIGQEEIESGFGDLRLRGHFRLWRKEDSRLTFSWELGTGTGTTDVFPYATQALEFVAGVVWVDTLNVLEYWAELGYESINRRPDDIIEERVLANFGRVSAGLAFPMGPLGLRLGTAVLFNGDRSRDHYFAQLTFDRRPHFRFFGAAQIEGGSKEDRVADAMASVGMIVYF
jgi:hypothetical protein